MWYCAWTWQTVTFRLVEAEFKFTQLVFIPLKVASFVLGRWCFSHHGDEVTARGFIWQPYHMQRSSPDICEKYALFFLFFFFFFLNHSSHVNNKPRCGWLFGMRARAVTSTHPLLFAKWERWETWGKWIPPTPLFLVSTAADSWAPATVKIRGLDKLGTDLRRASSLCNHLMRPRTRSVYMFIASAKRAEMSVFMYVFSTNGRCVKGGEWG